MQLQYTQLILWFHSWVYNYFCKSNTDDHAITGCTSDIMILQLSIQLGYFCKSSTNDHAITVFTSDIMISQPSIQLGYFCKSSKEYHAITVFTADIMISKFPFKYSTIYLWLFVKKLHILPPFPPNSQEIILTCSKSWRCLFYDKFPKTEC